jgi:hypothetical protein
MKKQILLLGLILCVAVGAYAQQMTTPMNFVVNSPATVAGTYEYGYASDWGPVEIVTTCGDLAWGYNAAGDSLGCDPIVTDLTGKIGMVSRGVCNFSLKIYHIQAAGGVGGMIVNYIANPADEIVNMLGGDSMTAVTIPSVFVGYGTGGPLATEMAMSTVNACFFVPSIDGARGLYNYAVPKDQAQTLQSFEMTIYNNGSADETNVVGFVEITDPLGVTSTISENVGTIGSGSQIDLQFAGSYTPPIDANSHAPKGRYTVKYSLTSDQGTYANEEVIQYFDITEDMFRNDADGTISSPIPTAASYANLRYDIGNMYYPSSNGVATHASFVLTNAGYMHGEPMDVILYDTEGGGTDYTTGAFPIIGFTSIVIDSTIHGINDTIVIPIESFSGTGIQNDLIADSSYLITVQYNALSGAGLVDAPEFGVSSGDQDMWASTNTLLLDQLYSGWASGDIILRLHMDFNTSVRNLTVLDELAAKVYPNPARDFVTLDLNLEEVAQDVDVQIVDLQGRVIRTFNYNEIQEAKYTYDVSFLGAGNYFLRVQTENGFTTKHFIVIK